MNDDEEVPSGGGGIRRESTLSLSLPPSLSLRRGFLMFPAAWGDEEGRIRDSTASGTASAE